MCGVIIHTRAVDHFWKLIFNMKAKKSLGQHFLRSEKALTSIIATGELKLGDVVLEIGPGEGVLTKKLLENGCSVLAIEKDDELFKLLKTKFSKEIKAERLILEHEDILKFDLSKPIAKSYKLIANIPYNITGAILEKFLASDHQPERMVLLVQKEVAQRIVAKDNKESILSLSVKVYGTPKYIETVRAGSFAPMPTVDSAIISIENISKAFFSNFPEKEFFRMLKAGFQAKRKKLSSNLSVIFDKNLVQKAFHELNLDENVRAEDVSLENWQKLAENLFTTR